MPYSKTYFSNLVRKALLKPSLPKELSSFYLISECQGGCTALELMLQANTMQAHVDPYHFDG